MFPLTTLRITVCGILMAADWGTVGGAEKEATVRLVSEFLGSHCAGKLQMLGQGSWASVCQGRTQTLSDMAAVARVVCRQISCGDVVLATSMRASTFQQGPIFMGPVECGGEEANLQECAIETFQSSCYKELAIVCSAFLPPPVLSVLGHGRVSSVYVHEERPLEISCMLVPQWLKSARVVLVEVKDGRTYSGSAVSSGESETWNLQPPVRAGEYACYVTFYVFNKHAMSSLSDSVIVTTGSWYPPSTGLIVGALFTTLIGAGILVYVCICRVHKEGSQGNSAPEEAQTEIPTTTPWADAENQTTTPGDNTEDPETPLGSDTENPISTPEANTDRPGFSLGEEHDYLS